MDGLVLQCAMLSHLEEKVYSVDELYDMVLECSKYGASCIHIHIDKVGGIENFYRLARMLEANDDIVLNIGVSDYSKIEEKLDTKPNNIKIVSVHICDTMVFGKKMIQTYENAVLEINKCISNNFFVELNVFNWKGVLCAKKLNELFPGKFYVGVYLGYPDELEASEENISRIIKELQECSFVSFAIYNNEDDELIKYIYKNGAHLRCGLEDSIYCNGKEAASSVEMVKHYSKMACDMGRELAKSDVWCAAH